MPDGLNIPSNIDKSANDLANAIKADFTAQQNKVRADIARETANHTFRDAAVVIGLIALLVGILVLVVG